MFENLFSLDSIVNWVEFLTIAGILVVVGYFFYSLNLFKKE